MKGLNSQIGNFMDSYIEEHHQAYSNVQREIELEIRNNHFQKAFHKVILRSLLVGLQEKEDELNKKFFNVVYNSQLDNLSNISLMTSGFWEKRWNQVKDNLKLENLKSYKTFLKSKSNQENKKLFKAKLTENMKLYNESIQELVEGQREVMLNPDHLWDDGQTTKEKLEKIKEKMNKTLERASSRTSEGMNEDK
jgi:RNAse (barnase) inhibitor barstar